jgi:Domain of unknown function (DUF4129)
VGVTMDRIWLAVCTLVMEAAWISGVGAVATGGPQAGSPGPAAAPLSPFPVTLLTAGAGYLCGRALLLRTEDDPAPYSLRRAWLAFLLGALWTIAAVSAVRHLPAGDGLSWVLDLPAAAAAAGRGLHPDLLATALTFFAWWRGQRSGAGAPDSGAGSFGALVRAFGTGALLLSGALLFAGATGRTPPGAGLQALLFLGAGLPALSLARLREVRRDAESAGSEAPGGFEGTWLRSLALPMGVVIALALMAGALLGDETVRQSLRWGLGLVGSLVWAVLYWPLLGVGYAIELLLFVLTRLIPTLQDGPLAPRANPLRDLLPEPDGAPTGAPPWVAALRWLLPGLVVLAVVAAFLVTSSGARAVILPRTRRGPERESLWSWSTFWRALRGWLSGLGRRLRVALPGAPADQPRTPTGAAAGAASGVRALYRRLLALGRANGLPRAGAQTAQEYFHSWRQALPGEEDAGALTAAYERARYGHPDEPPPAADGLQGRLEHLGRVVARQPRPGRAGPPPRP